MIAVIKYIKVFGLLNGISTYIKLKYQSLFLNPNDIYALHPPCLQNPIFLRSKTSDRSIFNEIFLRKGYRFSLDHSPQTIIDAGANIGLFSVLMASLYPQANIIAIEPDPENFRMLEKNTKMYPKIKLLNYGLWSKNTWLEIQEGNFDKSGVMVQEAGAHTSSSLKAVSIPQIMSDFNLKNIDLIKIDIEGSEKEVFSLDSEHWLPKTKILIIELHDRIIPGCSKIFFEKLSNYNFNVEIIGQNLFCRNLDLSS